MKKVYLLLAAVIFSFCSAFAEEVDLTRAMFHEWDNYEANANIVGDGGCDFVLGTSTGMPYGNSSVIGAQYADLSEYTELKLTVTEGAPRLLLNRPGMGGDQPGYIEINAPGSQYVKSTDDGVWVIDIAQIVADKGYAHLNVIKGANWANVTVTAMKLVKEAGAGPEPEPEPEPVAPAAQEEVTDLTKDMFKEWTLPTIGAEEKGPGYGAYDFNVSTGLPYGDGNVDKNHYADVSAYDYLDITVKEGTPRPLFNRDIDDGQAPDHLIDMPNNAAQTAKYRTETTNADGTKTYRFALNAIMADYGYVHLHCIKGANWANTTVTSAKLVKIVETAANFKLKDIKAEADKTVFIGTILGANSISVENEVTNIRDWNGEIVTPAKLSTNAGKLIITTESPLPRGDYRVHIVPSILKLNDKVYEGTLDCILAVGEKDEAALKAYEEDFANEIETAADIKEDLIYGVNLFQYAPGLKKKIQAEMDEAEYYAELLVEEEHIYNVIADLRMYMKSLRPILPQTDKEYRIKHKPTGLYLNISGENVILSKEATPVQFHLIEPSEGPSWDSEWSEWVQVDWTMHYSYIYATPERKYLGYTPEEKEGEFDGQTYKYWVPNTTNKKNTAWFIEADSYNSYCIEIAYKYSKEFNYDLGAPDEAKEGAEVTIHWDNPCGNWFIEDNDSPSADIKPETPEEPEEPVGPEPEPEDDGMTEIAQDQGKTLDDFTRAELVEGEEYNTYTVNGNLQIAIKMQNIDVAGCDYVVIKFAEPVAAGWHLAFWTGQDLVDVPAGATEFKFQFNADPLNKNEIQLDENGVALEGAKLPQICMMTFFGGFEAPLTAKITGIWKHTAATGDNSSSEEVTSISSVEAAANATAIYNAAGARTNTLQKGINIVKMANGKVVKIMK